jgi:hypothetical protein
MLSRSALPSLLSLLVALAVLPGARPGTPVLGSAPTAALGVFPGHPRLIVGGYRGVPIAELRGACERPELRDHCAQIGGRHVLDASGAAMPWPPTGSGRRCRRMTSAA